MRPAIIRNEVEYACLYVDGQPFPLLAGELHNSALRGLGINTVLAAVAWESIEPQEGV